MKYQAPKKFPLVSLQQQRGYLVMVAVIMIIIVGLMGVVLTSMFYSSSFATASHYQSDQALYLAEAGIEHATHKLLETTVANRLTCAGFGSSALTNTFGAGNYSVTGVKNFAGDIAIPGTLTVAVTATATTIPVSNTTDYSNSGRIMLDSEYINYTSKSSNSFNNVTRGVDGTTPAIHAIGAAAGQYQCVLTSLGGVPNLSAPMGQRSLQMAITLQDGWAVGDVSGGNYTFGRFNNPTEAAWNRNTATGGVSLYGVFQNSYADVWIVGASGLQAHWNGNAFTTTTFSPAVNYRSVWCLSSALCFAVGDISGGSTVIQNYNGTTWTRAGITGLLPDTNLKSVQCSSATNCWAVGDNVSPIFPYFYLWNGATWTATSVSLSAYPYNGVFCNSATDCWAVGANSTFARKTTGNWGGSATGLPSVQYNGIFCNATNDCWAVGNNNGNDVIAHWNGTAWSLSSSLPTPVSNLNAVNCVNANDCWAVGAVVSTGLPAFLHYDGNAWTQFTTVSSGPFPVSSMRAVAIIGPSTQPWAAWQENFD